MLNIICHNLPNEPHRRRGHCSAIYESGFYIWHGSWLNDFFSGYIDSYTSDPIYTIHRLDLITLDWTTDKLTELISEETTDTEQNLFKPLNCTSICQNHNTVYGFGGHSVRRSLNDPFKNTLYAIDLSKLTVRWLDTKGQVPCQRDKTVVIFYKECIYLFGGWSYAPSTLQPGATFTPHPDYNGGVGWNNEFYMYDLAAEKWFYQPLKGHFPPPTAASTFTAVGDKAYLIAGRNPPQRINDIYILDLITMEWSHIDAQLSTFQKDKIIQWPTPRSSHAVSPIYLHTGDLLPHLVLFGGLAINDAAYNEFWILDIENMSWQKGSFATSNNILTARTWFSMGAIFNSWSKCIEVILFGGVPGPLGATNLSEVSETTIIEIGISSLKRLSFILLANNIDRCITDTSKLTGVFHSNLMKCKYSIENNSQEEFSLYRYNPFIPFPTKETITN